MSPRPDAKIPANASLAHDGWSSEDEATATCFCGAVQLIVPLTKPGLVSTFACNCQDCRKVTASAFATNFTALQSHTKFARGEDNLTKFAQNETPVTGGYMTNGFCKTCGTLMYRQGSSFPDTYFLRVGTVDDHRLHDTVLRPEVEYFTKDRVEWLSDIPNAKQVKAFTDDAENSKE